MSRNGDKKLSPYKAGLRLGLSARRVRQLAVVEGRIPYERQGPRLIFIREADLEAFQDQRQE